MKQLQLPSRGFWAFLYLILVCYYFYCYYHMQVPRGNVPQQHVLVGMGSFLECLFSFDEIIMQTVVSHNTHESIPHMVHQPRCTHRICNAPTTYPHPRPACKASHPPPDHTGG